MNVSFLLSEVRTDHGNVVILSVCVSVCACMQTQHKIEMDKRDGKFGPPTMVSVPPLQQMSRMDYPSPAPPLPPAGAHGYPPPVYGYPSPPQVQTYPPPTYPPPVYPQPGNAPTGYHTS